MKLVAQPMVVPSQVNESFLRTTPAGVKVADILQEGVSKGYLRSKSVDKYLEKWGKFASPMGTCFGQASAVMMADKNAPAGTENAVMARASVVDAVALQILNILQVTLVKALISNAIVTKDKIFPEDKPLQKYANAMRKVAEVDPKQRKEINKVRDVFQKEKKVEKKIEKTTKKATSGDKKATKKLEKLTKKDQKLHEKIDKVTEKTAKTREKTAGEIGIKVPVSKQIEGMKSFREKVILLDKSLMEEQGTYRLQEQLTYSHHEAEKLKKKILELKKDDKNCYAIRLSYWGKETIGHAVALFINPRSLTTTHLLVCIQLIK